MDQKQICSSDLLPPLSDKYPWLVAQTREKEEKNVNGDQIFYNVHNPLSHFRCRIPELLGRHIRGCFHGWVILSNGINDKWSLWNPITSKLICLPHLILKDGDSINDCYLSSPPYDPGSIILFMTRSKPNFVFCRLDGKIKKSRWIEMSYSKQLRSITNNTEIEHLLNITEIDDFLLQPVCCNGKVYALSIYSDYVIQLHIVVKEKEVEISLVPFVSVREITRRGRTSCIFLKGSCEELFIIGVGFTYSTTLKLEDICLYKLDMTSMVWVEMNELNGMVFFIDLSKRRSSVTCSPPIASELGGYIHILHTSKVIYSYDVKDKTISMSSMHCLDLPPRSGNLRKSHISVWTIMPELIRLEGGDGEAKCKSDAKQDEDKEDLMVVRSCKNDETEFYGNTNELQLSNIPFCVLKTMMEFCIGVEYLNFRATCKLCHLAAPVIQWSNEKARRRLQTYSLRSPWLMAFEIDKGIITFTDPMFGDKYFIKPSQESIFFYDRILCSRYGWLLLFTGVQRIIFFNPFTGDIRELPRVPHVDCFGFSAPPTSPDCMVVAFSAELNNETTTVYLHSVGQEPLWRIIHLDFVSLPYFWFPTFCGRDVYVLSNEGGLQVLKDDSSFETVVAEPPRSCCGDSTEYFLVKCDQHVLLLVVVEDFGGYVEVFKLEDDCYRKEWEKMDGLGRHMIYICGETCVCMDAKTPEMENKIYFPLLHSKNKKMVFYSLETCRYHTFKSRDVDENLRDVFETKQSLYTQAWIEPSWA